MKSEMDSPHQDMRQGIDGGGGAGHPVFIVGLPRSGTTVFYRCLAAHPDFAWLSPATRKFARSYWLSRVQSLYRDSGTPVEGSRIWRRFAKAEDDRLTEADLTPEQERYYREVVETQMRVAGKERFLCKHPRNGLRIPYFRAIFPDACFIHLIRDGRAVAESILRCRRRHGNISRWWDIRPPGWRKLEDRPPAEQVGEQWRRCVEHIRTDGGELPLGRYIEVRYENFCDEPEKTLFLVGERVGVEWTAERAHHATRHVESFNDRWRSGLSGDEFLAVETAAGSMLSELGYMQT